LERYSGVEKGFDTGKGEEETGRTGWCQLNNMSLFAVAASVFHQILPLTENQ